MRHAGLLLALLLCSCISAPPTQYWQLAPQPSQTAPAHASGPKLRMGSVNLPGDLDRRAVVTLDSATQVNVHQNDNWAGPLAQMMQSVLAQDLAQRLPGRMVPPDDPRPPKGTQTITVTVVRFVGDANGQVVLQAHWTTGNAAPHQASIQVQAASGKTGALVEGMSKALGQLADRIAAQA